jgi:hypothetical protein
MVMHRRSIVVIVAVVSMVGLLSSPATAVTNYQISERSGATFLTLTTHSLFSGFTDDEVAHLSTTSSGALHMPFAVRIYGKTKSSMWVSSNGNIQFGTTANTAYANDCLPSSVISGKLVAVFWDDLVEDTSVSGQGVFTKTQGSAPNRRFIVSWQGVRFADGDPVLAQVTFFESSNTIKMVYGRPEGESATIGVQNSSTSLWKQFSCDSGLANTVFAGLRLDFIR